MGDSYLQTRDCAKSPQEPDGSVKMDNKLNLSGLYIHLNGMWLGDGMSSQFPEV